MFIEHGDVFLKFINDEVRFQKEFEALERIFSETDVPVGGNVLDLCCGSGTQALNLAKKGFNVSRGRFLANRNQAGKKISREHEFERSR